MNSDTWSSYLAKFGLEHLNTGHEEWYFQPSAQRSTFYSNMETNNSSITNLICRSTNFATSTVSGWRIRRPSEAEPQPDSKTKNRRCLTFLCRPSVTQNSIPSRRHIITCLRRHATPLRFSRLRNNPRITRPAVALPFHPNTETRPEKLQKNRKRQEIEHRILLRPSPALLLHHPLLRLCPTGTSRMSHVGAPPLLRFLNRKGMFLNLSSNSSCNNSSCNSSHMSVCDFQICHFRLRYSPDLRPCLDFR